MSIFHALGSVNFVSSEASLGSSWLVIVAVVVVNVVTMNVGKSQREKGFIHVMIDGY